MKSTVFPARVGTTCASVALLLALAACSTPDAAPNADDGVTVDTVFGEVRVPDDIDSVVVLEGRRDLDIALSLDLPVTGYPTMSVDTPLDLPLPLESAIMQAEETGARALFAREEINIEAIAAASPSLIISRADDAEPVLAELQAIAPVLAIGEQTTSTWQDDLLLVGEATGREERARELIDAYDERVADISERHAEAIQSTRIAPVSITPEQSAIRPRRLLSTVLQDIGASPSQAFADAIAASPDGTEYGSEQLLETYRDADALIALVNLKDDWDALQINPLWRELPAVESGNVVRSNLATHEGGPITADSVLDMLETLYGGV